MCSYPTYEEWKPLYLYLLRYASVRSYPTYEEWKQGVKSKQIDIKNCSYPTYEEWKHSSMIGTAQAVAASFLSYLWGMETKAYSVIIDISA